MSAAELLALLVSIPSVSGNEQQIADRLEQLLRKDGFAVQRVGNNVWFSIGAEAGPHLLFVSHLDTVPACDGWNSDPHQTTIADGKIVGLGANDAKGCVAGMIFAARELHRNIREGRVTFAFVVQEETSGEGIRATRPHLGEIDAAIIGEPSALEVCIAQRGMLILRCVARGEAAHVAHGVGENAIHKAARDIGQLAEMRFAAHDLLGETRAQVTQISGGIARNQVPDRCEFFVDFRTTPNLSHDELAASIGATLESEVIIHSSRYEPVATNATEPIVRAALEAAGRPSGIGSNTTSDWAFIPDIPAVKIGPGDTQRSHRPNEYLLIGELEAGAKCYARLARAYFAHVGNQLAHA